MSALAFTAFAALAACPRPVAAVAASPVAPKAWPPVHMAMQQQYSPFSDAEFAKPWWYDFPGRRLRVDTNLTRGTHSLLPWKPAFSQFFSSYWLNNTLYMYDHTHHFCLKLNQHMGIMRPDWFLTTASQEPSVYLTHRSEAPRDGQSAFRKCSWMRKDGAGYGWFDYFADEADGSPFRLTAPGPTKSAFVINDFLSMETPPSGQFNDDIFELPRGVPCVGLPGELASLPVGDLLEKAIGGMLSQGEGPLPGAQAAVISGAARLFQVFSPELLLATTTLAPRQEKVQGAVLV